MRMTTPQPLSTFTARTGRAPRLAPLLLACVAAAGAGCAVTDPTDGLDEEGVAGSVEAITNGSQVTSGTNLMARSIVSLSSLNYALDDSTSWPMNCTGNIVGSRHVVTAGQCGSNKTTTVRLFGQESRAVREVVLHPSSVAGHAIALVRLNEAIPSGYLPMALATTATAGEHLFGAGYGQHQPAASGLFWNVSAVRRVQGNVVELASPFTSPGDSGGPIFRFANDVLELVGTLRSGGTYASMPYYRAWMLNALNGAPGAGGMLNFEHSNKCVDVPSGLTTTGLALQQMPCTGGNNQRFVHLATRYGSGVRRFRNASSSLCIDLAGSVVVQRPCDETRASQLWELYNNEYTNRTQLRNKANGQCLDVPSASAANGAGLQTYACHTGLNQRVRFQP